MKSSLKSIHSYEIFDLKNVPENGNEKVIFTPVESNNQRMPQTITIAITKHYWEVYYHFDIVNENE